MNRDFTSLHHCDHDFDPGHPLMAKFMINAYPTTLYLDFFGE